MLDPREREVLKLVALAKPIKAIAAQLFMDRKTVSNYITRICDKLEMEKEHSPFMPSPSDWSPKKNVISRMN